MTQAKTSSERQGRTKATAPRQTVPKIRWIAARAFLSGAKGMFGTPGQPPRITLRGGMSSDLRTVATTASEARAKARR